MKSAVRVPRVPPSLGWFALGAALLPIAYGYVKKVRHRGLKKGSQSKLHEPNAAMKAQDADAPRESASTSTQADNEEHASPAGKSGHISEKTASPAGHEEVKASKAASKRGTQSTPRKKSTRKTKPGSAELIDQPLNPKDT